MRVTLAIIIMFLLEFLSADNEVVNDDLRLVPVEILQGDQQLLRLNIRGIENNKTIISIIKNNNNTNYKVKC